MQPRHVAVEGPIGVGKTTLARRLAEHLGAREIFEDLSNPFLASFYAGDRAAAFQCQLYFLLMRYRQQRELVQGDLFEQSSVADYLFEKDRIFAYLNLDETDLNVYEKLFVTLTDQVARPDLVIYLQASDDVLLERIARRNRTAETHLAPEYLSALNKAYNDFFFHYSETPLLVVNTSSFDLAEGQAEFGELIKEIERLDSGTRYFVPA